MSTSHLGLSLSPSPYTAPAAFLAWNWFYAYCALSSRTLKQYYGIDHNGSPRQDLVKYADEAVKQGKMTSKQVERVQRCEAAGANSVDGFTFFGGSVLFALVAGVERESVNAACAVYTAARLVYGPVYIFIEDDRLSQIRGVTWWIGNASCLYLLWKGAKARA